MTTGRDAGEQRSTHDPPVAAQGQSFLQGAYWRTSVSRRCFLLAAIVVLAGGTSHVSATLPEKKKRERTIHYVNP